MRKIIGAAHLSLDGVMQGPGGPGEDTSDGFDLGGWSMKYQNEKSRAAVLGLVGTLAEPNDLLLGRKPLTSSPAIGLMFPPTIGSVLSSRRPTNMCDVRSCPIFLGQQPGAARYR